MKFYIIETQETKEITLKAWTGSEYTPDMFSDLEVNFPSEHELLEGSDEYICTEEEYNDLVEF